MPAFAMASLQSASPPPARGSSGDAQTDLRSWMRSDLPPMSGPPPTSLLVPAHRERRRRLLPEQFLTVIGVGVAGTAGM